jgi:hypothetical protein
MSGEGRTKQNWEAMQFKNVDAESFERANAEWAETSC